jgi:hypothetical protein
VSKEEFLASATRCLEERADVLVVGGRGAAGLGREDQVPSPHANGRAIE